MSAEPADVAANLAHITGLIAASAARAGRPADTVEIIAVTKTFPAAVVSAALAAGLSHVGENYVQEARAKRATLMPEARAKRAALVPEARAKPAALPGQCAGQGTWHLIGGLQRNKVRAALACFDRVDTLDSAEIAAALAAEAERAGRRLPVLLQVNVAGERTKRGARPEEVEALARAVLGFPALALEGLMTIPPEDADGEASRRHFRGLRELRNDVSKRLGVELPHLSMGMSNDFAVAVEEGATFVRLGRALFGARGTVPRSPGSSTGGGS